MIPSPAADGTLAALDLRSKRVLAGGSTHIARSYRPPLFVDRARGSRKWLSDGRELIDCVMGHGALLLGHAHPSLVDAVTRQVAAGTHFGAGHALEIAWAERIAALVPSAERVRFTSSGTEATLLALRLARAATGRDLVATVREHFHGWHDAVVVAADAGGRPHAPAGVPDAVADGVRIVDPSRAGSLERALADRRVAALILEASGAHYGRTPLSPMAIAEARKLCDATGTLLVFDEVVTGFRVDPGGMQALLGVRPDLSTFAKVAAGGLPGGAVGGRTDVMDQLGFSPHGDVPTVRHPGTFNGNPLSAAAGIAMLDQVATGAPTSQAAATAELLEAGWQQVLVAHGIPGRVWRLSSIVHLRIDDEGVQLRLGDAMRAEGVDLFHTSAFVSAVHTPEDVDLLGRALARSLARIAMTGA